MRQHERPCRSCAFRVVCETTPDALGGSNWQTYVGQLQAGFYLPCHETYNRARTFKDQRPDEAPQCAGAAIFRANLGLTTCTGRAPLALPADHDNVFSTFPEFVAHYTGCTPMQAERLLRAVTPEEWATVQLNNPRAKVYLLPE